jgi:hypothetical protein
MKTDKEIMKAFQEQFNTGRLLTESQVLVLMGYARAEEKRKLQVKDRNEKPGDLESNGYSFETGF